MSWEKQMQELREKAAVMDHYANGMEIQVFYGCVWHDVVYDPDMCIDWNMLPRFYRIKPNKRRVYAIQFNRGDALEFREVEEAPKFARQPYWHGWMVEES